MKVCVCACVHVRRNWFVECSEEDERLLRMNHSSQGYMGRCSSTSPSASGNIDTRTRRADKNFYLDSASQIDLYLLSQMRKTVIEGCVWVCVLVCMTDTWMVLYSFYIVPPRELFSSVITPCNIEWLTVWLSFNGLQGERGAKGACGQSGPKGVKVSNKESSRKVFVVSPCFAGSDELCLFIGGWWY